MRLINAILLLVVLCTLLGTVWIFSNNSPYVCERGDDAVVIQRSVLFSGIFLYPVFWDLIIGYDILMENKALVFAFVYPMLVTFYQIIDDKYDQEEDMSDVLGRHSRKILGIQGESTTIISTAFAMGGLFMILPTLTKDSNVIRNASYMVVIALLICVSLMLPTANYVVNSQRYTYIVRNIQRVCLNYALGLIIASLIIIVSSHYTGKTSAPSSLSGNDRGDRGDRGDRSIRSARSEVESVSSRNVV